MKICLFNFFSWFLAYDLKLVMKIFLWRYSGYCAWRGIFYFSGNENSETIVGIHRAYPELGNSLYFDLGSGTHSVFYELPNKRLNWIWYVNQSGPELKVIAYFHPICYIQFYINYKFSLVFSDRRFIVWFSGFIRIGAYKLN